MIVVHKHRLLIVHTIQCARLVVQSRLVCLSVAYRVRRYYRFARPRVACIECVDRVRHVVTHPRFPVFRRLRSRAFSEAHSVLLDGIQRVRWVTVLPVAVTLMRRTRSVAFYRYAQAVLETGVSAVHKARLRLLRDAHTLRLHLRIESYRPPDCLISESSSSGGRFFPLRVALKRMPKQAFALK